MEFDELPEPTPLDHLQIQYKELNGQIAQILIEARNPDHVARSMSALMNIAENSFKREDVHGARLTLNAVRRINAWAWFVPAYEWFTDWLENAKANSSIELEKLVGESEEIHDADYFRLEKFICSIKTGKRMEIPQWVHLIGPAALFLRTELTVRALRFGDLGEDFLQARLPRLKMELAQNRMLFGQIQSLKRNHIYLNSNPADVITALDGMSFTQAEPTLHQILESTEFHLKAISHTRYAQ